MGKNKRGGAKTVAAGVFKVAGAKSLKKNKSKAVQLGLKNIKKKVDEVDAQFLALSKQPPRKKAAGLPAPAAPAAPQASSTTAEAKEATKRQIVDAAEKLVQMDV